MLTNLICLDADDTSWHNLYHLIQARETLIVFAGSLSRSKHPRCTLEGAEAGSREIHDFGAKSFPF